MPVRIVTHPAMLLHEPGPDHPESPLRLQAILDELARAAAQVETSERTATRSELCEVHEPAYVDHVLAMTSGGALDEETFLSPGSVDAAQRAAGVVLEAVDAIRTAGHPLTFALVRPPGHHAGIATGMGYCIFNNAAIAVRRALASGSSRVLLVDWDVHHGNGTQELLGARDDVLVIDLHQDSLFPEHTGGMHDRGRGPGAFHVVNLPMPAGSQDADYLHAMDALVLPLAASFAPELVVVSAGFDAHWSDAQANEEVSTEGFAAMAERLRALGEACSAPILFVLEGGYDPVPLARNVRRCVEVLDGGPAATPTSGEASPVVVERAALLRAPVLAHLEGRRA